MSDSVDRVFAHALNTVKRIPRTGSARPPSSARLKLYGLYKQSMEGDVEGVMSRPPQDSAIDEAEREKWDAWSAQHGLSRTEAKRRYISTLIETMHQYASTTREARELVAELEFVWDQIKSNSVSSASSPGRNQGFIPPSQSTMPVPPGTDPTRAREVADSGDGGGGGGSGDGGGGGGGGGGDLRPLRPSVSDADQESEDGAQPEEDLAAGPNSPAENYELRNRKWKKRIEQILSKMTAEIAALREQLESRDHPPQPSSSGGLRHHHHHHPPQNTHHNPKPNPNQRRGVWAWMLFFIVATARHLIVDAIVVSLWFWLWRRSDARVRDAVKWVALFVRERLRRVGVGIEVEGWRSGRERERG